MKGWLATGLLGAVLVTLWPVADPALGERAGCQAYSGLPPGWGRDPLAGMQRIAGGQFSPGTEGGYQDERPFGPVTLGDFWIDRTEVTRAQFAAFVQATGYVTEAQHKGVAAVFNMKREAGWHWVAGADWRHPQGPGVAPAALDSEPVTQVTLADAMAYAQWRGNTLPTEAEWEYAARAGQPSQTLAQVPADAHGRPVANYWQGVFPLDNTAEDGFAGVAPVGCFTANANGLYDMIGNVWEWTGDTQWAPLFSHGNGHPGGVRPTGEMSAPHVIKGGSYLCASSYCARYRTAARERQDADLATSHVGFRTLRRM